jgi:anti-anti-sigma factor
MSAMSATFEIIGGMLFVTGSLDRGSDTDLTQALEKYAQSTPPANRIIDMSNVRWLSPSGAKVLIAAGQEAGEKNGTLRILASRHVLQTLNLLGAKTWLTIESCMTPNPKPVMETSVAAPPSAPAPKAETIVAPKAAAPAEAAAPKAESASSASESQSMAAVPATASGIVAAVAAQRPSGSLAGPHEELSRGGQLLRVLYPNRRYSFHFAGGELILGLVRERVGGSWVIVETAGTRKIINLDMVEYCEIL